MLFSNVLVPFDGSAQSQKALEAAVDLVKLQPSAKLTVVHVYDFLRIVIADSLITAPNSVNEEQYELAEQTIQTAEKYIESLPNETHTELRQGAPAKTIVEYAKEINSDLIVIGSRGLGSIGSVVLGSVSHNVVQHTNIPVLIIK